MDFDKLFRFGQVVHKALGRAITRYEKQKAAEEMYNFIVRGIVATVLSVVLSLVLPYWFVVVLFVVIGLLRFIDSYNNINTGIKTRKLLKTLKLWNKQNDDILIKYLIYGAVVFVTLQIVRYFLRPRTPFVGIKIINFFSFTILNFLPVIFVVSLLVLFITLFVSIIKEDIKYITVGFVILFPVLLPLLGIYILKDLYVPYFSGVLAEKNIIEKIIFYLSIALFVDTVITTMYKRNFSNTFKWKMLLCLLLAGAPVLIYLDKIELIKDILLSHFVSLNRNAQSFN